MLLTNPLAVKIKYFTAKVSPRANDPDQPFRQHMYLRALATLNAQIVYGRYLSHVVKMFKANQVVGEDPFVEVVKTEEKGTDVNYCGCSEAPYYGSGTFCCTATKNGKPQGKRSVAESAKKSPKDIPGPPIK